MDAERQAYFIPRTPSVDGRIFDGSILLLPMVSLGNVPQLAVDLLIHGTHLGPFELVGILDPADHIPVVGALDRPALLPAPPPPSKHRITTPIEVYQTRDRRYTLVQQRSPVIKARKARHISRMRRWISGAKFESVLVVVSVDAAVRGDEHLREGTRMLRHEQASAQEPSALRRAIRARYPSFGAHHAPLFCAGGLAARLLRALASAAQPLEVNTLVSYVAEGDNRPDALFLADEICSLLRLAHQSQLHDLAPSPLSTHPSWILPLSWKADDSHPSQTRQDLYG
ncbi:hypothetical protein VP01_218g17 [Puccinia sorghi]|uniref:Proteasome assembly chaperone 2 n=1 Tax=Puccinia sorghi TaxID=27349 RepID=A0A0L6V9C6_9BASI|nr:hypothetical protein VP01_218g17 [Puccinia sorghi]